MMEKEKNMCVVSVIIPTYGRPDFLKRAVESALQQTYPYVEIIVVDDNNPGTEARIKTEEIMRQYVLEKHNVIYLQHEQNKNGSAARNTGINHANGKYICLLDDDDEMLPPRIELFVKKMESLDESWGACYSGFTKIVNDGVVTHGSETREGDLYNAALMRSLYFCPGSNLFARTHLAKQIGGFDEDFWRNQDIEFLARLLEISKIARIPDETLIIHCENRAPKKDSYANIVKLEQFYLGKFKSRIEKLPPKEAKKLHQFMALERLRFSIQYKCASDGIRNCIKNRVSLWMLIRYSTYVLKRVITKKSFGFEI